MSLDLIPALAKAASDPGLLREVYGDLLKPGVSQVGKALASILGLGNTALWPVQLLNERARLALEANLESYRQKLLDVPIEKVVPVVPEIGVPIAERLGYISDPDLRELYSSLLARASVVDTQSTVHPSFVNVLNNLTPDEAQLMAQFRQEGGSTPMVSARLQKAGEAGFYTVLDVHFRIANFVTLAFPYNLPAYVSNLEGLGLIRSRTDMHILPVDRYLPLEEDMRTQFKQATEPASGMVLTCEKGKIEVTRFGWLFLAACSK